MYNLVFNSFSSKTVLIQCDHKRRDSSSSFLIAFYLKKLGYNIVLGSRLTSKSLYFLLKPELVLLTHPNSLFTPKEMAEAAKYTTFALLHPESSGMLQYAMIDHMRGGGLPLVILIVKISVKFLLGERFLKIGFRKQGYIKKKI
ncbi:hypothetical protein LEP1GSC043_0182 [Leptospira weilii str. Ecochallenge]|uniref:Uncharacterized protein n=1 Tax=Leptospira weilii str. Ecochallenge TaxID=1049986 RepID=N1U6Q4_9LEPT|nr:hypothetical protein LEP1GSC043_0182 [Leptospira weilii str. Ecochallenge]